MWRENFPASSFTRVFCVSWSIFLMLKILSGTYQVLPSSCVLCRQSKEEFSFRALNVSCDLFLSNK